MLLLLHPLLLVVADSSDLHRLADTSANNAYYNATCYKMMRSLEKDHIAYPGNLHIVEQYYEIKQLLGVDSCPTVRHYDTDLNDDDDAVASVEVRDCICTPCFYLRGQFMYVAHFISSLFSPTLHIYAHSFTSTNSMHFCISLMFPTREPYCWGEATRGNEYALHYLAFKKLLVFHLKSYHERHPTDDRFDNVIASAYNRMVNDTQLWKLQGLHPTNCVICDSDPRQLYRKAIQSYSMPLVVSITDNSYFDHPCWKHRIQG